MDSKARAGTPGSGKNQAARLVALDGGLLPYRQVLHIEI
jgi:hypothetical protein